MRIPFARLDEEERVHIGGPFYYQRPGVFQIHAQPFQVAERGIVYSTFCIITIFRCKGTKKVVSLHTKTPKK